MTTPSPQCEVKDGAAAYVDTIDGVDITPGNTVIIRLASSAGVSTWSISCITTDDTSDAATIDASLVRDDVAKTATFTAPSSGRALRFQVTVNAGVDVNGTAQPSYTTTFCLFTLTVGSLRVGALDETFEGHSTYGWMAKLNSLIRNPAGASVPTGTGLRKVVAGVEDAAASLLVNADVNTAAAIAVTKIATSATRGQVFEAFDAGAGIVNRFGYRDLAAGTSSATGSNNNVTTLDANSNPVGTIVYTGASAFTATGYANGTSGRKLVVINNGTSTVTLTHNSGSSSAGNKIWVSELTDLVLGVGESVLLHYDGTYWNTEGNRRDVPLLTNSSTGTLNDVSTSTSNVPSGGILFTGAAPSVTGFAGGYNGRTLRLLATGGPLVLNDQSASSTAANRIITGSGGSLTIPDESSVLLVYDATNSRWRVIDEAGRTQTLLNKTFSAGTFTGSITASGATLSSPTISGGTLSGTTTISGSAIQATGNARARTYSDIANVQTNGTAVTTLFSWTILDEATTKVVAEVCGCLSTGAETAAYVRQARIKRDGGTVTVGTVDTPFSSEEDSTWDCTIDNSTSTGRVRVTGDAGIVDWGGVISRLEVSHA